MKYALGALWLVLALVSSRWPVSRRIFAYAGSVLALVHVCALGIGKLGLYLGRRPADEGPPVGGFIAGIIVGLILGLLLGGMVSRNTAAYWMVQVIGAGFLMFLPLFRV